MYHHGLIKTGARIVQHAFGLTIPQTLEEVCDPARTALIVYDMQVGIVSQLSDGHEHGLATGRHRMAPGVEPGR